MNNSLIIGLYLAALLVHYVLFLRPLRPTPVFGKALFVAVVASFFWATIAVGIFAIMSVLLDLGPPDNSGLSRLALEFAIGAEVPAIAFSAFMTWMLVGYKRQYVPKR